MEEWGRIAIELLIIGGLFGWKEYSTEKGRLMAYKQSVKDIERKIEEVKQQFIEQNSYLSKKGENTATKEDIKEITREIEAVKSEIQNIGFRKQDKFIQFRELLIKFQSECITLCEYSIKNITCINNYPPNGNNIRNTINTLLVQRSKADTAFWNLYLYVDMSEEEQAWMMKIKAEYLKISPYYFLTIDLLENCALKADLLSQRRDMKIAEEYRNIKDEYVRKRKEEKIEKNANIAIKELAILIKLKLDSLYK